MAEIWRPVPGYQYIEASNRGQVRSITHTVWLEANSIVPAHFRIHEGCVLKPRLYRNERWQVNVLRHGPRNVGNLVCRAFKGAPPPDKPWALHRNGINTDDRPRNLYWGTPANNTADSIRHGTKSGAWRGGFHHNAKLTEAQAREIKRRRAAGEGGRALAAEFGVSEQTVCCIKMGRQWGWLK